MDETSHAQLRRELNIALDGVTKLADRLTKTIERVNTLYENDKNLVFRIESARGEALILAKVVADMLARECLNDRNPPARPEKQEREQEAAIAASYRDIANVLRDEAMKTISATQRR